jgi:hypothetical protein
MSMCLLGGMLVSRHLGMHDYALLLACYALSDGLIKQGFLWLATPPVYIAMLLPEPWNALGVVALAGLFVVPFIEFHREDLLHVAGVRRLMEAAQT